MKKLLIKVGEIFLDLFQTIVLALSLFVIMYLFFLQPHQVKGSSMTPSFQDKEMLLTDKVSYRFRQPQRGDVVIFKALSSEPCADIECEYIKRVVGLPNERVKIQEGLVYINGQKLKEDYLLPGIKTSPGSFLEEGVERKVPEGEYLTLGDNRSHSRDSREFGPVPKERIIGKAWLRYWPYKTVGIIKKVDY
jgi:signal peptidase I